MAKKYVETYSSSNAAVRDPKERASYNIQVDSNRNAILKKNKAGECSDWPLAIQTKWIKGLCRERYLFGRENSNFPEVNFGVCAAVFHECGGYSNGIWTAPSIRPFGREEACLPGKKQTPVNWQDLVAQSSHAIAGLKERWNSSSPSMARNGRTETVKGDLNQCGKEQQKSLLPSVGIWTLPVTSWQRNKVISLITTLSRSTLLWRTRAKWLQKAVKESRLSSSWQSGSDLGNKGFREPEVCGRGGNLTASHVHSCCQSKPLHRCLRK